MNLTDDQIRSLRAVAEEAQGAPKLVKWTNGMPDGSVEIDAPTVLSLVEEVQRLRAFEIRAATALGEAYATGWAYTVDALAAKAEAGKGLVPFAAHKSSCTRLAIPTGTVVTPCNCGFDAALARWEAMENG